MFLLSRETRYFATYASRQTHAALSLCLPPHSSFLHRYELLGQGIYFYSPVFNRLNCTNNNVSTNNTDGRGVLATQRAIIEIEQETWTLKLYTCSFLLNIFRREEVSSPNIPFSYWKKIIDEDREGGEGGGGRDGDNSFLYSSLSLLSLSLSLFSSIIRNKIRYRERYRSRVVRASLNNRVEMQMGNDPRPSRHLTRST